MKHKRLWLAAGLVLAAAAVAVYFLLTPKIEERPASIMEAVNRVEAHPYVQADWQPAVTGMSIYGGGQVRTGAESWARLSLLEGAVRLAADTLFTVKACETHQNQVITTLFLQEGRLWAHLTAGQPHQFTVETVGAVAAVRDTDLSVRVAADRTTLVSVARGQVALTAQGERVTVTAGQQAVVSPGRAPGAPEPMSDEERRLWATEGELPELAPPTPTATATPTPTPTPKPSPTATPVKISLWVDVYGHLTGPAGEPAGRDPLTILEVHTDSDLVAGVTVTTPAGQIITLPPYGDVYGQQRRFTQVVPGLPQAGGRYTFTALAADGQPLPGGVASDVYLGGYEPEPPVGVSAQAVDNGLLVTWKPSPLIPGAFNPAAASSLGFYQISLHLEGRGTAYGWNNSGRPLPETAHLIPLRQQDFGPGDFGQALAQLDDGLYFLDIDAFSVAPPQTVGSGLECSANDPAESVKIIIEAGQVRVELPTPTPAPPPEAPTATPTPALNQVIPEGIYLVYIGTARQLKDGVTPYQESSLSRTERQVGMVDARTMELSVSVSYDNPFWSGKEWLKRVDIYTGQIVSDTFEEGIDEQPTGAIQTITIIERQIAAPEFRSTYPVDLGDGWTETCQNTTFRHPQADFLLKWETTCDVFGPNGQRWGIETSAGQLVETNLLF